jgi:hypothetical protein
VGAGLALKACCRALSRAGRCTTDNQSVVQEESWTQVPRNSTRKCATMKRPCFPETHPANTGAVTRSITTTALANQESNGM